MYAIQKSLSVERQDYILSFYPMVYSIARRLIRRLPPTVDIEDMVSVGVIGLIEAYDRFDQAKGIPFRAYAELRVRGAMIDELRKQDWVPRSVRRRAQELDGLRESLHKRLGRKAKETELADELKMNRQQFVRHRRRARIHSLVSIDQPLASTEACSIRDLLACSGLDSEASLVEKELRVLLMEELGKLNEREKIAVELYFFERKSLKSIGDRLNVTESRACQIRGAAVRSLRKRIERRLQVSH
ncbi:MAG: RNA polymerase sigma factor FliA [Myxococcota bacterium]|nr:RNA polymerase sigma factor FliA [Myxococcota bacterium]